MNVPDFDRFGATQELSPRVMLFKEMTVAYSRCTEATTQLLTDEHNRQYPEYQVSPTKAVYPYFDTKTRFTVRLGEVDEVGFSSMHEPQNTGGFCVLVMNLYSDKSPYVYEDDLARHDSPSNMYELHASPELPPFLVSYDELAASTNKDAKGLMLSAASYLDRLRAEGRHPRFLTDEETETFIGALRTLEIDSSETIINNSHAFDPVLNDPIES